jgi:hypothetical protein
MIDLDLARTENSINILELFNAFSEKVIDPFFITNPRTLQSKDPMPEKTKLFIREHESKTEF